MVYSVLFEVLERIDFNGIANVLALKLFHIKISSAYKKKYAFVNCQLCKLNRHQSQNEPS